MDTDLSLKPSLFRRNSIRSSSFKAYDPITQNNGASVFAKPKSIRTEDDIREAITILKEVPFYASMQKDDDEMDKLLTETLDAIQLRTFRQGEILFHQTDEVSEFYIIIEGTVDVYAQKTEDEMNEEVLQKENELKFKPDLSDVTRSPRMPRKSQFINPSVLTNLLSEDKSPQFKLSRKGSSSMRNLRAPMTVMMKHNTMTPLLGLQDCYQMHQGQMLFRLKNRRTLGPGTHFGELALANNCAGNVTVVAASNLKVAALSKTDFGRICNESDRSFQEKINFFAKLMGRASRNSVARFCYGFKERHYSYGQKIFIQGQLPSEVYLVKHGEVQITNQDSQEKTNLKSKRFADKIANLGPYNFLGTGEVSEEQPYKMTATSCSHDLTLYVIPIKDFHNLKSSYKDVFERFSEKFNAQLSYFEDRVESVCSINKKVLQLPSIPGIGESKTPKGLSGLTGLTPLNLNHIHSTKYIEKKIHQASTSDLRCALSTRRTSILLAKNDECSPQSFGGDYNMLGSLSHRSQFKTTPKAKEAASKQAIPKEKNTFGDYCDILIPLQDMKGPKHAKASSISIRTTRASRAAQDLNDREFKIETTLKILAEHAKNRRSSCDDAPPTTFLMEQNPSTIFRNCK